MFQIELQQPVTAIFTVQLINWFNTIMTFINIGPKNIGL